MPGLVERWRHLAGRQTRRCVDIVRVLLCSRWHLSRRRTRVGRNGFIHGLRAGAAHHTHRFWTVVGEAEGRAWRLLQQQRRRRCRFSGGEISKRRLAGTFLPLCMPSLRSTSVHMRAWAASVSPRRVPFQCWADGGGRLLFPAQAISSPARAHQEKVDKTLEWRVRRNEQLRLRLLWPPWRRRLRSRKPTCSP